MRYNSAMEHRSLAPEETKLRRAVTAALLQLDRKLPDLAYDTLKTALVADVQPDALPDGDLRAQVINASANAAAMVLATAGFTPAAVVEVAGLLLSRLIGLSDLTRTRAVELIDVYLEISENDGPSA